LPRPYPRNWLVGISSVANAVGLASTGSRFLRPWGILPFILCGLFAFFAAFAARLQVALPVDLLAPFVALGGVAVAVWLTVRTLRRKNSVYKPPNLRSMFATQRPSTGVRS
jgi:hypothetical protein